MMTKFQHLSKQIQTLRTEEQVRQMELSIENNATLSLSDKQDLFFLLELQDNALRSQYETLIIKPLSYYPSFGRTAGLKVQS